MFLSVTNVCTESILDRLPVHHNAEQGLMRQTTMQAHTLRQFQISNKLDTYFSELVEIAAERKDGARKKYNFQHN